MMMQRKAFTSASRASASRASTVRVCAQQNGDVAVQKAALASVAAAAMLMAAAPVHAGVVLQQPQLKNALVVEDNAAPAAPAPKKAVILPKDRKNAPAPQAAAAPAAKAAPAAAPSFSSGGDIDAKSIALPASLAVLAGGAFAITKLDDGFAEFMDTAAAKDSGDIGAGYETVLKSGGPIGAAKGTQKRGTQGTKRVKAATKTASTSPLGSLFGSKEE